MTEWVAHEPTVERGSPPHKASLVRLQVARRPQYYVNNIVGIITMLSLLGFLAFFLPVGDLGDRINLILTLLLTAVAFKFVVAESIPRLGYQTHIDSFVLYNMFFLFSVSQNTRCHPLHECEATARTFSRSPFLTPLFCRWLFCAQPMISSSLKLAWHLAKPEDRRKFLGTMLRSGIVLWLLLFCLNILLPCFLALCFRC